MAITFDATNRRIILDSASVTATEIYSRWKDWVLSNNSKWPQAFRTLGGDEIGGGLYVASYYFLMNDWRVRPMESDHSLVIDGALLVDGGVGSPVVQTLGNYRVLAQYTVPVQAQGVATSGGTLTANQVATAVWGYEQ